jgi:hypothetical protein
LLFLLGETLRAIDITEKAVPISSDGVLFLAQINLGLFFLIRATVASTVDDALLAKSLDYYCSALDLIAGMESLIEVRDQIQIAIADLAAHGIKAKGLDAKVKEILSDIIKDTSDIKKAVSDAQEKLRQLKIKTAL